MSEGGAQKQTTAKTSRAPRGLNNHPRTKPNRAALLQSNKPAVYQNGTLENVTAITPLAPPNQPPSPTGQHVTRAAPKKQDNSGHSKRSKSLGIIRLEPPKNTGVQIKLDTCLDTC